MERFIGEDEEGAGKIIVNIRKRKERAARKKRDAAEKDDESDEVRIPRDQLYGFEADLIVLSRNLPQRPQQEMRLKMFFMAVKAKSRTATLKSRRRDLENQSLVMSDLKPHFESHGKIWPVPRDYE